MSINMGGFQSSRVDCWATLPATAKSAKKVHKKCQEFVLGKVSEEVNKIHKEYEDIKGKLEI
jgi:hypothetical protein